MYCNYRHSGAFPGSHPSGEYVIALRARLTTFINFRKREAPRHIVRSRRSPFDGIEISKLSALHLSAPVCCSYRHNGAFPGIRRTQFQIFSQWHVPVAIGCRLTIHFVAETQPAESIASPPCQPLLRYQWLLRVFARRGHWTRGPSLSLHRFPSLHPRRTGGIQATAVVSDFFQHSTR